MDTLAHAKLNLTLDIVGIRPDGYHLLDSLFVAVNLHDTVSLVPHGAPFSLACTPHFLPHEENLAYRAAHAFMQATGLDVRARVHVQKRIPMQAGLGGGSADAAAVLRLLQSQYPDALTAEAWRALALSLGADVPFGLVGGAQHVTGIGEELTPIRIAQPLHFVLLKPQAGLSTREVFLRADARPAAQRPDNAAAMRALATGDLSLLSQSMGNALQPAACELLPEIGDCCALLKAEGALVASMTGSGSTVFGLFADADAAARAQRTLAPRMPFCLAVQSLS